MKLHLLGIFLLLSTGITNINAQGANDLKARIEFEDAEKAFSEENYEQALVHINRAEELLGSWNPKIGYLKIVALDKITDYSKWDNKTEEILVHVQKYMEFADKNVDKIDLQKLREISIVERVIKEAKQRKIWKESANYIAAYKAEEIEDYKAALNYYKLEAATGNLPAMVNIFRITSNMVSSGLLKDSNKEMADAVEWLKKAAEREYTYALYFLGEFYSSGQVVEKNFEKAIFYFKKAAENGHTGALSELGYLYSEGEVVSQNYDVSLSYYKTAALKGNSHAIFVIGIMYEDGEGCEKNASTALKYYLKAAELGSTAAMNSIGFAYEYGELGKNEDFKEALKWYQKGADLGNARSMINIGDLYFDGSGVEKDYKIAVSWYEKANTAGYEFKEIDAYYFAESYYNITNYSKALEWYIKAYELGKKDVKYKIAEMYREGIGTTKDKKLAKEWLNKY
jgi:TPR repeat protein